MEEPEPHHSSFEAQPDPPSSPGKGATAESNGRQSCFNAGPHMLQTLTQRRGSLIGIIALLLVLGACILVFRNQEGPRWKGHSAAYWIERFRIPDRKDGGASAEEFLVSAGPEVLGPLIEGLGRKERIGFTAAGLKFTRNLGAGSRTSRRRPIWRGIG